LAEPDELKDAEQGEMEDPSPRKIYKDHTVYLTQIITATGAMPVLCDFGEARFGKSFYAEHAMPDLYRAPEILLGLGWTEKIDIWALGLVVRRIKFFSLILLLT
jgi:serine/threonine-protein kinase SRPK3